ncbi:rhamnogalacturonan acetylesterase [Streptomyces sp. NBC_01217]|uniref:rhamnogalacturonan acetylesterase n=1 Tax=Streptomyces sp. NBC_01217 TaxID=2903779 RepID=UPI002E13BFF3|nr:rhamnogalacturonan acetylesterase [Streptomyces sp. NBC_01217]
MNYTAEPAARRGRIFVAGDSTAVTRPVSHLPMAGWAQALPLFLTDDVEVVNCARARASSKSFRERGRLQWILENMSPGDYLLFGFGQIDWKPDPGLHTDPYGSFLEHMRAYATGVRDAQGHPVVLLPFERRRVDRHGNVARFLGDYPVAMRQLAREEHLPVVDLYGQSLAWWEELGPENSKDAFTYLRPGEPLQEIVQDADNVHLRPEGAVECARYVARSLLRQQIVPPHWVTGLDRRTFSYDELGWLDDATFAHLTKSRVSVHRGQESGA